MRILDTIAGVKLVEHQNSWVSFISRLMIDNDGSGGNVDNDPHHQPDTSLHYKGNALNAQKVRFIVVPPVVCQKTKGVVLGSLAYVTNLNTGKVIEAVVGDIGPKSKVGEGSPALAKALGFSGNANSGGTTASVVGFEIVVGTAAEIDGILYDLQPYGKG